MGFKLLNSGFVIDFEVLEHNNINSRQAFNKDLMECPSRMSLVYQHLLNL